MCALVVSHCACCVCDSCIVPIGHVCVFSKRLRKPRKGGQGQSEQGANPGRDIFLPLLLANYPFCALGAARILLCVRHAQARVRAMGNPAIHMGASHGGRAYAYTQATVHVHERVCVSWTVVAWRAFPGGESRVSKETNCCLYFQWPDPVLWPWFCAFCVRAVGSTPPRHTILIHTSVFSGGDFLRSHTVCGGAN